MSRTLITAVIVAIVISSAVSTALSFAVVEISGGGEQGPQGLQGPVGPEGPQGPRGPAGVTQFGGGGEDFALCADSAVLNLLLLRVLPATIRNVVPIQTEIEDWERLYELDVDECR